MMAGAAPFLCVVAALWMFPGVCFAAPMTDPNTATPQPAIEQPPVEAVAAPLATEPGPSLPVAAADVVTLPVPDANPVTWASFLKHIAPAIAKVGCRAAWFTGFVFHSRKHILTTRQALNNDCELQVRFKDGKARAARVVAWSDEDWIAILELTEPAPSGPLPLTRDLSALHAIGEPLATVAATTNYMSVHKKGSWLPPRLRFATLSAFEEQQVLFDLPVSFSDMGAPVFAPDGRVVAIIVGAYAGAGPARAVTSERIEHLRGSIGKQGEFTRPDQFGTIAGVLATPFSTRDLLGASFYSGGRTDVWLWC